MANDLKKKNIVSTIPKIIFLCTVRKCNIKTDMHIVNISFTPDYFSWDGWVIVNYELQRIQRDSSTIINYLGAKYQNIQIINSFHEQQSKLRHERNYTVSWNKNYSSHVSEAFSNCTSKLEMIKSRYCREYTSQRWVFRDLRRKSMQWLY